MQGHSTSNEQIFRNPHALRLRILFNFLSGLPNYPDEQIQNLSFLLQIVLQLKLFNDRALKFEEYVYYHVDGGSAFTSFICEMVS